MIVFKSLNIWNGARFKSKYIFISGHFPILGMLKTRKYISYVAIDKLGWHWQAEMIG